MARGRITIGALLIISAAWLLQAPAGAQQTRPSQTVRIGVLAYRGIEDARRSWQPTADYLGRRVPEFAFEIVPLTFAGINEAVRDKQVDFVATNPANYVELEARHAATRIATLLSVRQGVVCTEFAGVIFTRADRADIQNLGDLRGKRFIATDVNSFGGWWMAWRELKAQEIDPHQDFASLEFAGIQDEVVYAVRGGRADAGTVRTDQLEQMAAEGKIDLSAFRVLNQRPKTASFPFVRSTRLYPEWPMARLDHTPEGLGRRVAVALLEMPADSPAARAAGCAGWTIPLDYTPVHDLLKDLQLGPYKGYGTVRVMDFIRQHVGWSVAVAVILVLLVGTIIFFISFNQRLRRLRRSLVRELSERQKAQVALAESEQRHRAVVEQASEGIYLLDADSRRIIEANPALARLLRYPLDEIRGKEIYDIVGDAREAIDERIGRVLQADGAMVGERRYTRKDGSTLDVGVSASVIDYAGRPVLCTVVHDITERKRAHQLLEQKNLELETSIASERQALRKLKSAQSQLVQAEKLAGLGQMVAGVAHEINNPLSFVANNVAVLQRDIKAIRELLDLYRQQEQVLEAHRPAALSLIREVCDSIDVNYTLGNLDEMLVRCREGLRRIQQIVKDLRDFARLDDSDLHEADINAGIESTANIIVGRAKKKQVRIDLQLGKLPPVICYPAKVNQVVMNLLSNAIDASREGAAVTVLTRAADGEVQIEVADRGSGIDPEIRDRIFDPFFTTKPPGEGTGLGLSISYGIIQDHGGHIEVDSTPGQGARFTVHLPLRPSMRA